MILFYNPLSYKGNELTYLTVKVPGSPCLPYQPKNMFEYFHIPGVDMRGFAVPIYDKFSLFAWMTRKFY